LLTFDNTKAVRLAELKRQRAADESKKEIEELVAEKAELDKEQLDENLKKIGAKIEAYHGGDLNGGSSRAMSKSKK
jgi:glycerophosphoryl diester phosphodiesterase